MKRAVYLYAAWASGRRVADRVFPILMCTSASSDIAVAAVYDARASGTRPIAASASPRFPRILTDLGLYPIVTLEEQLLNMIGKLE